MKPRSEKDKSTSTSLHFFLIFLLASISIVSGGYFYFKHYEKIFRSTVEDQLSAIADLKIKQISDWYADELHDAALLSRDVILVDRVDLWLHTRKADDRTSILAYLSSLKEEHDYVEILVASDRGEALVSTDTTDHVEPFLVDVVKHALDTRTTVSSDFYLCSVRKQIHIDFVSPLPQEKKTIPAALVFRMDARHFLFSLVESWPTPSRTAETLLIRREGDEVVFLNELRHQKDTALELRFPIKNADLPAVKAVLGQEGIVEGKDYRGVRVIAAVRAVPGSPWFLVSKIDRKEVYTPLKRRLLEILGGVCSLLLALGLGVGLIWRHQRVRFYREKYETAEALRSSEEKFIKAFRTIPDALVLSRIEDGKILEVNDNWDKILGYSREEVFGKTSLDLNMFGNPADRQRAIALLREQGFVRDFELQIRRKSGELRTATLSAETINIQGESCMLTVIHDITGRKRAEEALKQSEERKTIQNQIAAIFLSTPDEEMYGEVLTVVLQVMKSKFGVFGFIAKNGDLVIPSMTREIWSECQVPDKSIVFPQNTWGESLWARAIRERKVLYSDGPFKTPKGHIPVDHFLTAPIIFGNETIGLISVANNAQGYTENDKELLENITHYISPILNARLQRDREEQERKRVEEALATERQRLSYILQGTNVGTWEWNVQTGETIFNERWAEIIGYTLEEISPVSIETWKKFAHPDDLKKSSELLGKHFNKELEYYEFETRMRHKDGSWIWVLDRGKVATWTEDGKPLIMSGTHQDITDRKRAEEAIRQSEEQFRTLFMSLSEGFYISEVIYDDNGKPCDYRYLEVNPKLEEILGLTRDQIVGKRYQELVPVDTTQWLSNYCEVARTGVPRTYEFLSPEYHRYFETYAYQPVKGQVSVFVRDITERKQIEKSLTESEERYRNLIEVSPYGVGVQQEGTIIFINPTGARMLGAKSPEEILGKPIREIVHPDTLAATTERVRRLLQGETGLFPTENRYLKMDGSEITVEVMASRLIYDGKPAVQIIVSDITERKRMENALKESEERYRNLIEVSPYGIGVQQEERIVFINPAGAGILGVNTPEELLGKDVHEFIHPDYIEKSEEKYQRFLQGEVGLYPTENRFVKTDGSEIIVEVMLSKLTFGGKPAVQIIVSDITERKRMEESLRESETRYRSLFENINSGVAVYEVRDNGKDFVFKDFNPAGEKIDHDRRERVIGRSIFEVRPGVEQFGLIEVLRKVWKTGRPIQHPVTQYQDERLVGWYENYVYRILPNEIVAVFEDVTDRKRAEEELQEREQLFRSLFESSPNAIMLLDPHHPDVSWPIIDCNEEACRMNGYAREELIGQSIDLLNVTPGSEEERRDYINRLRQKDIVYLETFHRRKDGSIFPIEVTTSFVTIQNRELLLGIDRDITEHKLAEEALKESEARFRNIYENMTIGMYRTTPDGQIVMCNPALIQMLGYASFEELAQRNLEKEGYEPKYDRKLFRHRIESDGEIYGLESAWMKKDGSFIHVSESAKAIKDEEGKVLYYEGTVEDITARKRAEEQIRKDLEEKEVMLKEIHHRVKNNLTVISSLLNLQSKQIKTKQQALEAFKESRDRVFAMSLVHEKLYRSRNFSSVDMKSYLDDMARQLVKMYRVSQNVQLKLDVQAASIDINRAIPCGLILNELITNALKYAFPEERKGEITVSFRPFEKTFYELSVSDNGVGLPDDLDVENSPSLGLHLVRLLTEQLNGSLSVSREKGTSFSVRFPKKMR